jgi:hypothetical protein
MNKLVSVKIALIIGVAAAAVRIASPAFAEEGWVDPFILALRAPAKATDRFGDLPLGAVIRTDERYGADRLFQGPRGWDYWHRTGKSQARPEPEFVARQASDIPRRADDNAGWGLDHGARQVSARPLFQRLAL